MKKTMDPLMIFFLLFFGIEATETAIVHTKLTACSDGLLTIPVEPVKRDLIIDLYWKYRYSDGSEWTNVVYCNKTMAGCRVLIPVLTDGTRVSRGANDQSLTVEHSSQSIWDHIQFQFEVALADDTEYKRIFKVDFTIVCSEPTNRPPSKPSSHSMNVSASPSNKAVKPLLFGSSSAASVSQGQLWRVVLTAVAIFFASI